MTKALRGSLRLYAVVPAAEASALSMRRGFSLLNCGPVTALFGWPPDPVDPLRAALWHDRTVRLAVAKCSSVVPFRLGMDFASKAELRAAVRGKALHLAQQLERFQGRVEMGLKVRLPAATAGSSPGWPGGLDPIRALAPKPSDRCEGFSLGLDGKIFTGCYLVARGAVADFWAAVQEIHRLAPELPALGSGPWAPYSFCAPSPREDLP